MEVAREGRSEITGNKFTYKRHRVDSTSEVIMDRLQVALKEISEIWACKGRCGQIFAAERSKWNGGTMKPGRWRRKKWWRGPQ
jgi:hypothetical protein